MKKESFETRLDNIEEILKMLLINSVLGSNDVEKIKENTLNEFRDSLSIFGLRDLRMNYIENRYYLFGEIDMDEPLKSIKNNYSQASALLDEIKLVLVFDKLHVKRKKAFDEARISYYINSGEMKIF